MLGRARLTLAGAGIAVALWSAAAGAAGAAEQTRLTAGFKPERLGAPTALTLGVDISSVGWGLPSALTGIDFHYPSGLAFATSSLGLATCSQARLEVEGPAGCPANSRMGGGSAIVEFPLGPETREESAHIALVAAPSADGYLHVLIYANGEEPVYGQIVMSAVLLHGHLQFTVPLVPSLPGLPSRCPRGGGAPTWRSSAWRVTIGGNLTYEERIRGRTRHVPAEGDRLRRHLASIQEGAGARCSRRPAVEIGLDDDRHEALCQRRERASRRVVQVRMHRLQHAPDNRMGRRRLTTSRRIRRSGFVYRAGRLLNDLAKARACSASRERRVHDAQPRKRRL